LGLNITFESGLAAALENAPDGNDAGDDEICAPPSMGRAAQLNANFFNAFLRLSEVESAAVMNSTSSRLNSSDTNCGK
jgi:hypothetical protein